MSRDPDALARLLPEWHRMRDADHGEPLRELLDVIGEQLDRVREGVEQQYDDWFVETAAEWVLPYLGELVGYRGLPGYERVSSGGLRDGGDPGLARRRLAAALAPRRDVAATVGNRRRKGTLALLEELAADVAGWPARAVELSQLTAHHQPVRLLSPHVPVSGATADLRDGAALDLADGPFSAVTRSADVRRADSRHRPGGLTPAGVALFAWRLAPHSVTRAPAHCIDRTHGHYTFSVLGNDTPLVTRPVPEPSTSHIATIDNVPARLRRRQVADRLADYYGPGKSFALHLDGRKRPIPPSAIVIADLADWRYRPRYGQVAVDPELGRIAFNAREAPHDGVSVTYHHAFSDELGGGEYPRDPGTEPGAIVLRVGPGLDHELIADAYRAWREHPGKAPGVIEIAHSGTHHEQLDFELGAGDRLVLRAADGHRPVLRLPDTYSNRPDALTVQVSGRAARNRPRLELDGLLITGRGIRVTGPLGELALRHCTLVPGWSLEAGCEPQWPAEPSLLLERTTACVRVERCVVGSISVIGDEVSTDPLPIHVRDSVIDATAHELPAVSAPDHRHAHATLHLHRCTVFGEVHAHAVRLAEASIVTGVLRVARRGIGCLRHTFVPPGSRTPERHRCPADLAQVRPVFASCRYGTPEYARLADGCPPEIRRGAEDGFELGVFHDLYEPQREDNLRARIAEHTPARCDAGLIFVS
ncbi:hypothetical protein E1161_23485 [Saccharopolyspora aridisoli]|uniref:Uncharacterized protein n=1 Tax=Saccharopolyspora aridisoli TaxID=2530385 RepID=A0A4R4UAN2_9PSEU|nr:hypothetical protein [Saccharopolyspora aridisoli]TDC88598.1 hypothetical protein E1161_23485 [Saccharopolyspora aridisoli]